MLETFDYSNRRGIIPPMLDKIYGVISEYAANDKLAGLPPLPNLIIWKQRMRKILVDISSRWLFAMDGTAVAGLLFYRFGKEPENAGNVYIDELIVAWGYKDDESVFGALLDKFVNNDSVKDCPEVFAGERVRRDADKELLASKGFAEKYPGGYQSLGAPEQAADALRLRYARRHSA